MKSQKLVPAKSSQSPNRKILYSQIIVTIRPLDQVFIYLLGNPSNNNKQKKKKGIHLSYLQPDDQKREKSSKVLTRAVQTQWPATSLYSFRLSSQKRSLFGDVFANIVENMLSTIVPSFSVSMANRNLA